MTHRRRIDSPEPGFFKIQLTSKGPWLPATIYRPCPIEMFIEEPWHWLDRWPQLAANINGEDAEPEKVWVGGFKIDIEEWLYWYKTREHIRWYEPTAGDANPRKRIDWLKLKMPTQE